MVTMRLAGSWTVAYALLLLVPGPAQGQVSEKISATLQNAQYDLARDGRTFLIAESAKAAFFMLGGRAQSMGSDEPRVP